MCRIVFVLVLLLGAVACGGGESPAVESASSSPQKVMPELAGLASEEAVGVLQRAGISYVIREEPSAAGSAGSVVRTDPPGRAAVGPADVVIVYVRPPVEPAASPSETAAKGAIKKDQAPHIHELPSDPEAFLNQFAEAWGAQDTTRMRQFATGEVVKVLSETGRGEANVVWDDVSCSMGSSGEGGCQVLFMPEKQTQCCAQIWELYYHEEPPTFRIRIFRVEFAGDAG